MKILSALFSILFLLNTPSFAGVINAAVQVGIEGICKADEWNPVAVNIHKEEIPALKGKIIVSLVTTRDCRENEGKILRTYKTTFYLKKGQASTNMTIPVRIGHDANILRVSILKGQSSLYSKDIEISYFNEYTALVLTKEPSRFYILNTLKIDEQKDIKAIFPYIGSLPSRWYLYDAIDAIIMDDIGLNEINPLVLKAIMAWLSSDNKRLILTPRFLNINMGDSRLTTLIPTKSTGKIILNQPAALASYFDINPSAISRASILNVEFIETQDVASLLCWQNHPLMIKKRFGQGEIIITTFNLDELILFDSRMSYQFERNVWTKLLTMDYYEAYNSGWNTDYTTPKGARADYLYKYVFFYLLILLLVFVPSSYLVLKRFNNQGNTILFVIPAIVLIFSISAYIMGISLRGTKPILKIARVEIGKAGDRNVIQHNYLGILSADTKPYQILVKDGNACGATDFVEVSGGRERLPDRFPMEQISSGNSQIISTRCFQHWGMKFFRIDSFKEYPQTVEAQMELQGNRLIGSVTNSLPFKIKNAHLVYRHTHIRLGDLLPGKPKGWQIPLGIPHEYSLESFDKKIWKDDVYEDDLLEMLNDVMPENPYLFEDPVLVGVVEHPSIPISLNRRHSKRKTAICLYNIPLQLGLPKDKLNIPVGLAYQRVFNFQNNYCNQIFPFQGMSYCDNTQSMECQYFLPINIHETVIVDEVSIYFKRSFEDVDTDFVNIAAFNWEKKGWDNICCTNKKIGIIKLKHPQRFVSFPEAKLKLKVSMDSGSCNMKYLDISFKGRVD